MWKPTDKKKSIVNDEDEESDESIDEEEPEDTEIEEAQERPKKEIKAIKKAVSPEEPKAAEEVVKYVFLDQTSANRMIFDIHSMLSEMYQDWKKSGL